ncbi:MAG: peptidoglycan editing factor PgeF [Proteobacteria bacterium]|nr:peptidoglycan editing factor PgeF [Pseudomonadota bacterium]
MLILRATLLSGLPGISHGFFGRRGGVSGGIYASLNCGPGSGDDPAHVSENRRLVREALGAGTLNSLYQIHSPKVVTVTGDWDAGPQADAMVTATPGIALGILTADCAPVLFADASAGVVGAAHAGWKGAFGGVLDATLAAMETLGAARERIVAAIGPCISQANYEVGPEFIDRFRSADSANERFFAPSSRPDHHQFDLESYCAARLKAEGVDKVERLSACTYERSADFFSFRRTTHRGEKDYGREISAIALS